jgi:hypothetical protein
MELAQNRVQLQAFELAVLSRPVILPGKGKCKGKVVPVLKNKHCAFSSTHS